MDIFIKSFNRAFYLDRCIASIEQYVKGEYKIKVLDDGTPTRYLERIKRDHPHIEIYFSSSYNRKIEAIEKNNLFGDPFNISCIPVQLWIGEIQKSSEIFLLLEDDFWLVNHLDVNVLSQRMKDFQIGILKLFWGGNTKLVRGFKKKIANDIEQVFPETTLLTKLLIQNKFKIRSILDRCRLLDKTNYLSVYSLYSVAAAFYSRDYWLYLWRNASENVNENVQLLNALEWRQNNPDTKYCKMVEQYTRTSFLTSATNNFSNVPLDVMQVNHYLNEYWLNGQLDSYRNMPHDFPIEYISNLLGATPPGKSLNQKWLDWVREFKLQYQKIGCVVD